MLVLIFHFTITLLHYFFLFFFNSPPPTDIYTLSLHDALPICFRLVPDHVDRDQRPLDLQHVRRDRALRGAPPRSALRSEEHTSELQSQSNLVCRLLLEKKNQL